MQQILSTPPGKAAGAFVAVPALVLLCAASGPYYAGENVGGAAVGGALAAFFLFIAIETVDRLFYALCESSGTAFGAVLLTGAGAGIAALVAANTDLGSYRSAAVSAFAVGILTSLILAPLQKYYAWKIALAGTTLAVSILAVVTGSLVAAGLLGGIISAVATFLAFAHAEKQRP